MSIIILSSPKEYTKSRIKYRIDHKVKILKELYQLPTDLNVVGKYKNNYCYYDIKLVCNRDNIGYPGNTLNLYEIFIYDINTNINYHIKPFLVEERVHDGQEDSSYKENTYEYKVLTYNNARLIEHPVSINEYNSTHSGNGRNFYYDSNTTYYTYRYILN